MSDQTQSSPWEPDEGGFTVTLKAGKDFSDPWFVIRDNTVPGLKRRLIEAFGWSEERMEVPLISLVTEAMTLFGALGNVTREFPGARALPSNRGRGRTHGRANGPEQPIAEAAPEQKKPADPKELLLAEIEACTDTKRLREIWARENTEGRPFDSDVMAAWKAKGKSLQGGN